MATSLHASPTSGANAIGLVVADVGKFAVGLPIPVVSHILTWRELIHVPRRRACVHGLFNYEDQLLPLLELSELFGHLKAELDFRYVIAINERTCQFGFPVANVHSVTAIPMSRIRYPRDEEIAVDKRFVRGFWNFSSRRHGYILDCTAIYNAIIDTATGPDEGDQEDAA